MTAVPVIVEPTAPNTLPTARPQSRPGLQTRYSHLLYLSEAERHAYQASMERSSPIHSLRSVRSEGSSLSASSKSSATTTATSILCMGFQTVSRFVDDHYPLITTIHPETVPASVPKNHSALWCARQMAQMHNTIIRALNASWNHAVYVQPNTQEASDFLLFNRQLCKTLDQHHRVEDHYLFPQIHKLQGRPGAVEENSKGHESFTEGLAIFQNYLAITKPSEYRGPTFRHILESFAPDLIQHLHDEIATIVSLYVLDSRALMKIWKRAERLATKDLDLYDDAPWFLGCQDRTFTIDGVKGDFPGGPWIIEALVRKWHFRKHAGAWKFCPSDLSGRRRQLAVA
ncbi:hypothetical protein HRR83_000558 [Exophiala dermatitidis]|uniref:Hemerythrin-like domain-containing protein n=2 Tax=Exophiala dermatitidis TaxID=5970 RepID=H6C9Y0_EXODN|nr:uncharacterized protein HMPREF1120_08735 [Exophiala dermatitidis NIH/UT8656]KAJ4524920.1 hypothetical protein HRR75_000511 [Exophiala dermatitidis]EHY60791.1 hypothetical protein HMPREF1120_08735 [Exophiala dermatitidis NIH/UT8656]KAJ4527804.1 hypothetical protein HRR74_000559 [Exophiala dermatitidis]KAJ4528440.1 hypothetical protein HRR73_001063 [Exophiala dermatitidis]KAJ4531399.1 hypothetical protein HRR76_009057 [Exophiala dermatitidis]